VSLCVVDVRKAMCSRTLCLTPPSMLRSLMKALMEKRESVFVTLTLFTSKMSVSSAYHYAVVTLHV